MKRGEGLQQRNAAATGRFCQNRISLCPGIVHAGKMPVHSQTVTDDTNLPRHQGSETALSTVSEGSTPNIFLYSEAKRLG